MIRAATTDCSHRNAAIEKPETLTKMCEDDIQSKGSFSRHFGKDTEGSDAVSAQREGGCFSSPRLRAVNINVKPRIECGPSVE
jgi:hypothetical protein